MADGPAADRKPAWAPGAPGAAPWDPSDDGRIPVSLLDRRPEVAVGGAFAGGLLLALILKRIAS